MNKKTRNYHYSSSNRFRNQVHLCHCCHVKFCHLKSSPKLQRRRKIREISRPLPRDQLDLGLAQLNVIQDYSNLAQTAHARNSHLDSYGWRKLCQPLPASHHFARRGLPGLPSRLSQKQDPTSELNNGFELAINSPNTFKNFTLTYITDRILIVSYATDVTEDDCNDCARRLCQIFEIRYAHNYRIFNLVGFTKELHLSAKIPVLDMFWPVSLAPGLDQLITATERIYNWLYGEESLNVACMAPEITTNNRQNIAVIHSSGPINLISVFIAALLCICRVKAHNNGTGLTEEQNKILTYFDNNLIQHASPSQKRHSNWQQDVIIKSDLLSTYPFSLLYATYIQYYLQILCEKLNQDDRIIHLYSVIYTHETDEICGELDREMEDIENFKIIKDIKNVFQSFNQSYQNIPAIVESRQRYQSSSSRQSSLIREGCLFIKIYQNLNLIYTSTEIFPNPKNHCSRVVFPLSSVLPLHGDILITCYMKRDHTIDKQEVVFRVQFHTSAIQDGTLQLKFAKSELDKACNERQIPDQASLILNLSEDTQADKLLDQDLKAKCYAYQPFNLVPDSFEEFETDHLSLDRFACHQAVNTFPNIQSLDKALSLQETLAGTIPVAAVKQPSSGEFVNGTPAFTDPRPGRSEMWPIYSGPADSRNQIVAEPQDAGPLYTSPFRRHVWPPLEKVPSASADGMIYRARGRIQTRADQNYLLRQTSDPSNQRMSAPTMLPPRQLNIDVIAEPNLPLSQHDSTVHRRSNELLTDQTQYSPRNHIFDVQSSGEFNGNSHMSLSQLQALHQQLLEQHQLLLSQQTVDPRNQNLGISEVDPQNRVGDGSLMALIQRQNLQRTILQQQAQLAETLSTVGSSQQQIRPSSLGIYRPPQPQMTVMQLNQPSRLVTSGKGFIVQKHGRDAYSDERHTVKTITQELQDLQRKLAAARDQSEALRRTALHLDHISSQGDTSQSLVDQQRRLNLHRTRMALTAHERQLFEELRQLRLRSAAETNERLKQRHLSDSIKTTDDNILNRGHQSRYYLHSHYPSQRDIPERKIPRSYEHPIIDGMSRISLLPSKAASHTQHRSAPARQSYLSVRDLDTTPQMPDVRIGLSPELNIKVPSDSQQPFASEFDRIELHSPPISPLAFGTHVEGCGDLTDERGDLSSRLLRSPVSPTSQLPPRPNSSMAGFGPSSREPRRRIHAWPHSTSTSARRYRGEIVEPHSAFLPRHVHHRHRPSMRSHGTIRHYKQYYPYFDLPDQVGVSGRRVFGQASSMQHSPGGPSGSLSDTGMIISSRYHRLGHQPPRREPPYPEHILDNGGDEFMMSGVGGTSSTHHHEISRQFRAPVPLRGPHDVHPGSIASKTNQYELGPLPITFQPVDHIGELAKITLVKLASAVHLWYQPMLTRNQAIEHLMNQRPGAFVIRNSGSFINALGLALRVDRASSEPPTGFISQSDQQTNIPVRHYLIESLSLPQAEVQTWQPPVGISSAQLPVKLPPGLPKNSFNVYDGLVRFRGCFNEPIFSNLVSLLYEHSVQPLSLPIKLRLPFDHAPSLPSLIASHFPTPNPLRISHREPVPRNWQGPIVPMQGRTNSVYSLYQGGPSLRPSIMNHHYGPRAPSSDPIPSRGALQHQPRSFDGYPRPFCTRPIGPNNSMHSTSFEKPNYISPRSGLVRALYLGSIDMESDYGDRAIFRAVNVLLENAPQVKQTETTIEIRPEGITITDSWHKLFFRRHYPANYVVYCGVDPDERIWDSPECRSMGLVQSRIFGFLARKQNSRESMCHLFCEMPDYSAFFVVDQMNRTLLAVSR